MPACSLDTGSSKTCSALVWKAASAMPPLWGKPIPEPSQTCTQRPVMSLRTNCEESNTLMASAIVRFVALLSCSKIAIASCCNSPKGPEMKNSFMSNLYTETPLLKEISLSRSPTWIGFLMRYGMLSSLLANLFCNHNPTPLKLYLPEQCKFLTDTWPCGLWLLTVKFNLEIKQAPVSFVDFRSCAPSSGLFSKICILWATWKYLLTWLSTM